MSGFPPEQNATLDPLEVAILRRLGLHGDTVHEAADHLGVSDRTVQYALHSARVKLQARTTPHAVAEAIRRGLLMLAMCAERLAG
jgi:DNA-binding CsgD family transcriptional regulator